MIYVKHICNLGGVCPTQWEGRTTDGEDVYVRYRWGKLRIEIDNEIVFLEFVDEDQNDEHALEEMRAKGRSEENIASMANTFKQLREMSPGKPLSFSGHLTFAELIDLTKEKFQWPEKELSQEEWEVVRQQKHRSVYDS